MEEINCNKCGNDCNKKLTLSDDECIVNCIGEQYRYQGCYGSDVLEEFKTYTFTLCEPCLADLFKSFIIPVKIEDSYLYYKKE